ncbi:hypothetical protein Bca52824_022940 [Brassica carinata]|uniref:Uncharacterized protein n=1 Tax=Brassica carinata TaxID=52824 RepID=A0A8X7VHN9_BRACI|nr:hypothetical protein Bca52824_022940 [Brassica carinata]
MARNHLGYCRREVLSIISRHFSGGLFTMDPHETPSSEIDGSIGEEALSKSQPQEESSDNPMNSDKVMVPSLASSKTQPLTDRVDNITSIEAEVMNSESPSPVLEGSSMHPCKSQGVWNKPYFIAGDKSYDSHMAIDPQPKTTLNGRKKDHYEVLKEYYFS